MRYTIYMRFVWREWKNELNRTQAGHVSFEVAIQAIADNLVDDIVNRKHPERREFIVRIDGKLHTVPYVDNLDGEIFLITAFRDSDLDEIYDEE